MVDKVNMNVTVSIAEIKEGLPIYIRIRQGKVARTEVVRDGIMLDRGPRGLLLGIEIIRKVKASVDKEGAVLIDCVE